MACADFLPRPPTHAGRFATITFCAVLQPWAHNANLCHVHDSALLFEGVIESFKPLSKEEKEEVKFKKKQQQPGVPLWPCVKFACGIVRTVASELWESKNGDQVQASRLQVPLTLAWGMSIHKAQGMTLDRAFVSLGKVRLA